MIKIYPRVNSVIGATMDRIYVRRHNGKSTDAISNRFYEKLVSESGSSTNNLVTMFKNWKKAYNANLKKNVMISKINDMFK